MEHFKFIHGYTDLNDLSQTAIDLGECDKNAKYCPTHKYNDLNYICPDHSFNAPQNSVNRTDDTHDGDTQIYIYTGYRGNSNGWKINHNAHSCQLHQNKGYASQSSDLDIETAFQKFIRGSDIESAKKRQVIMDHKRNYGQNHHGTQCQSPICSEHNGRNGHESYST